MQNRLTAKEADNWKRFFKISGPAGYERDEYYMALIASLIVNVNVSDEQNMRTVEDFILKPNQRFRRRKSHSFLDLLENQENDIDKLAVRFGKKMKDG